MEEGISKQNITPKNLKEYFLWFLFTFTVFLVSVILYHSQNPFIFETNDDFFIQQIASGELTGQPEAHLLHIGILTGFLLRFLYQSFPGIAWYGCFLCFVTLFSISLLTVYLEMQCKKIYSRVLILCSCGLVFYLLLLRNLITVQYTTITILVTAAALSLFYLTKDEVCVKKYLCLNLPGFYLFFIAVNIRDKGCYMLLPIFFFLGLAKAIRNKRMIKSVAAYACVLLAIIAFTFGMNRLFENSPEWKNFRSYNTAREKVYDYQGYPSYAENRTVYDNLHISEQSYNSAAFRYQILLDSNINANSMSVLADVGKRNDAPDFITLIRSFFDRQLTSYIDRPLNITVFFCYLLVIFILILSQKFVALLDVGALLLGKSVIWTYILYSGRSVSRITQGIFIAELFILLSVTFYHHVFSSEGKHKKLAPIFYGVTCVAFLVCCLRFGIPYLESSKGIASSMIPFGTCYQEVKSYFNESPDKLYLCDVNSFSYFTQDILVKEKVTSHNSLLMGSWTANSPWYEKVLSAYNIDDLEKEALNSDYICFVFMDTPDTNADYLQAYYAEKYPGASLVLVDTIQTTSGIEFPVYSVVQ